MDTKTGEIVTESEVKRIRSAELVNPSLERRNLVPLEGLSDAELKELLNLTPTGRLLWYRANREKISKKCGRNQKKRFEAIAALGMSRKQLRENGFRIRPKTARNRAKVLV